MGDATKTEDPWYPDDSGEWIEYDGLEMPVPGDTLVLILLEWERTDRRTGVAEDIPAPANDWGWGNLPNGLDIVAYRLV